MASASKSTTLTNGYGNGFTLTAGFNQNSTSVANNTSSITCTGTFSSGNANWSTSYPSTLTIYWHDNRENYDRQVASINFSGIGANSSKTASGTITVTHKDDGTLDGYAYAYFNKGSTTTAWACNSGGVSTNWTTLTKIDRYATMTSASNFNDTQNPSFKYSNPRKLTITAWLEINPVGEHLATRTITGSTGGTYTWTLTDAERNQLRAKIPDAKTATCRIGIITTIGSTSQASYKDVTFSIVEQKPTFDLSYKDDNSTTVAITQNDQLIVRNQSNLQVIVENEQAYKSAIVTRVYAYFNDYTYAPTRVGDQLIFNMGAVNSATNTTVRVEVTDSRGFSTSKNITIRVLDWEQPSAIINVQRENNFYSETSVNVNADYSSLNNKNSITIKMRYKKTTASSYGSYVALQDGVTKQVTLDNNFAWNVQIVVQDRLATTTYNVVLDRGIPIAYYDRLKRSMGINCFPADAESLEVGGENIMNRIEGFGEVCMSASTSDWNTACGTRSGFYMGADMSNSPSGQTVSNWWWVIHLAHNDKYQRQIAFSFLNNNGIYTRLMNNGTWNSWTQV